MVNLDSFFRWSLQELGFAYDGLATTRGAQNSINTGVKTSWLISSSKAVLGEGGPPDNTDETLVEFEIARRKGGETFQTYWPFKGDKNETI